MTSTEFTGAKNGKCPAGGSEFKSASPTATYACNGEAAAGGGFAETLPSGKTETGWMQSKKYWPESGFEQEVLGVISIPIPVENASHEPPTPHYIPLKEPTTECPGSPEKPTATPGNLCVYERSGENVEVPVKFFNGKFEAEQISPDGGMISFKSGVNTGQTELIAVWAVTAE